MPPTDDPAALSPDDQLQALARLLAAGLRRLRPASAAAAAAENLTNSVADGLEKAADMVLNVHTG